MVKLARQYNAEKDKQEVALNYMLPTVCEISYSSFDLDLKYQKTSGNRSTNTQFLGFFSFNLYLDSATTNDNPAMIELIARLVGGTSY
jgi:hypothetical protein